MTEKIFFYLRKLIFAFIVLAEFLHGGEIECEEKMGASHEENWCERNFLEICAISNCHVKFFISNPRHKGGGVVQEKNVCACPEKKTCPQWDE